MDRVSGEQWWYGSGCTDAQRDELVEALASVDSLPVRTDPARLDLALHTPGHALLAEIHRLHQLSGSALKTGLPGVLPPQIAAYSVGFVGEELVGAELGGLPFGWHVLHSVPVGTQGSDVDHLVIGPPGLFAINSKHHRNGRVDVRGDAVFVGGAFQHYVRNSRLEVDRVRGRVGSLRHAKVTPVLCFVGAQVTVKEPPVDVVALDHQRLRAWLLGLPATLTTEQVTELFQDLRWADTWAPAVPAPSSPAWVAELARNLDTEHHIASQARRSSKVPAVGRASRSSARPPAASGRSRTSQRPRPPGRSRRAELQRVAVTLIALLALVVAGPRLLTAMANSVAKVAATQVPPSHPTVSAAPNARLGYAGLSCAKTDGAGRDPGGNTLACLPATTGSTRTTWQYADPYLRLPTAVVNANCAPQGSFGREVISGRVLKCGTKVASSAPRWTPTTSWKPN